jgi:hypothetical protein
VDSRSSSDPCAALVALVAIALAATAAGCVTVRPEEREFLADPSMTFGSGGDSVAHEEHVLSNREGSYGASTVTGGGCGCN